jgi:hypothetical protein
MTSVGANCKTSRAWFEALAASLRDRETRRLRVQRDLAALDGSATLAAFDGPRMAREVRRRAEEWRALVRRQVPIARQALDRLLDGRIEWTPVPEKGLYRYRGRLRFDRLLAGAVLAQGMASPTGFEPVFWP